MTDDFDNYEMTHEQAIEILENFDLTLEQAEKLLLLSSSYSRMPDLLEMIERMDEIEWLTLLGREWPACDNTGEHLDELLDFDDSPLGFRILCRDGIPVREMMDDNEQTAYDALPDEVPVYRGCYKNNKWGLSWSLDIDIAKKFPSLIRYRQEGQPLLIKALAKKTSIIAVKLERNESEIITYKPKHISTSHIPITWNDPN